MKKTLLFIFVLVISLIFFFTISETLFAFEWIEKGITVKSEEPTDNGVRLFLEDQTQRPFVVIAHQGLLTDPVKETVLSRFNQVMDTYNLPASNVEFRIKPDTFKITLILDQTGQTVGITHHGLDFPDSVIPEVSSIFNEFNAWKDLKIRTLQFFYQTDGFQTIIAPESEVPLIDIRHSTPQPDKRFVSELAPLYNEITGWKGMKLNVIELYIKKDLLLVKIEEKSKNIEIAFHDVYPKQSEIKKASRMVSIFYSWKHTKSKKLLLKVKGNIVDSVIALSEFKHNDKNLLPHVPSGMTFRFDDKIRFHFRVVSNKYFVQLKNEYKSEEKLIWQLNEAIKDPILYIQKYDPDYFYRQLEALRNRQAEVYNEMLTRLQESNDQIKESYNELLLRHEQLEASYSNLRLTHETFVHGFLTLENSGFLGSGEVDKRAVGRILELKADNIELTVNEVKSILKEEELEVSSKVIHLVFSLYINDFRE
jgi:hypothetical protein